MEKSPIGFHPSEFSKIAYLYHKAGGESSPSEDFIHIPTIDVYGNREPWELFDDLLEDEETHFFSNLKIKRRRKKRVTHYFFNNLKIKRRRTKRSSLPEHLRPRSVGAGAWKICPGRTKEIVCREVGIGFMSMYLYRSPPFQAHQDKRWILEEYTLSNPIKAIVKSRYCLAAICVFKPLISPTIFPPGSTSYLIIYVTILILQRIRYCLAAICVFKPLISPTICPPGSTTKDQDVA